MELSVYTFLYLFIVLAPFIIICSITLISLFNTDLKGICFLAGLAVTTFVTSILGKFLQPYLALPADSDLACKATVMSISGTDNVIPMGQVIISYTFWYFIYCIIVNGFVIANIGMIIFFTLLVIGDVVWNLYNKCFGIQHMLAAIVIGGGLGAASANVIDTISSSTFLYFFKGTTGGDVCAASNKKFSCNVTRNGKIIK
jgi:hypothetical protein